ncbi:MAG: glycosyltransferase family 2 protein [Bryobacteraceae bacterium]
MKSTPRLSIGMPVYNAERFVEHGLRSLLAQTFDDFEILLSDNASTDRTMEICRDYAAVDRRVRLSQNAFNRGGGWNHNHVLELATGEFFKWASNDDVCAPEFLEKCIAALDENPDAVLAHSGSQVIDDDGEFLESYTMELATDANDVVKRFFDLVMNYHQCYEIYGVIRSSALQKTGPMGNYVNGDGVLLAHLALYGPFAKVPGILFSSRRHTGQSSRTLPVRVRSQRRWRLTRKVNGLPSAEWWDPGQRRRITLPQWRQLAEYVRCVSHAPLDASARLGCYGVLAQWSSRDYRRYFKDLLIAGDQLLDNALAGFSETPTERSMHT